MGLCFAPKNPVKCPLQTASAKVTAELAEERELSWVKTTASRGLTTLLLSACQNVYQMNVGEKLHQSTSLHVSAYCISEPDCMRWSLFATSFGGGNRHWMTLKGSECHRHQRIRFDSGWPEVGRLGWWSHSWLQERLVTSSQRWISTEYPTEHPTCLGTEPGLLQSSHSPVST